MTTTKRNLSLAALGLTLAGSILFFLSQQPSLPEIRDLAITHVCVIDATGNPALEDQTVLVREGRIVAIGSASRVPVPAGVEQVNAAGKYLIPGLWDMHVHFWDKRLIGLLPPLYLGNGVTGVRDMGDPPKEFQLLKSFRDDVERGRALGPHIFTAGEILDGRRPKLPIGIPLHNEAEAREKVDWLKREGASFVKVYDNMPRKIFYAIVDEAKDEGLPVVGHVPNQVSALEASNAGQKSIEHLNGVLLGCSDAETSVHRGHGDFKNPADTSPKEWRRQSAKEKEGVLDSYNPGKAAQLFAAFAKNHTWMAPTLVMHRARALLDDSRFRDDPRLKYVPKFIKKDWSPDSPMFVNKRWSGKDYDAKRRRLQKYLEIIRDMRAAGVKILAGTDAPVTYIFPGFSLHDELELLVRAGLTPMESLQAATRNAAEFLGNLDSNGTIEKGKKADLVLLDANPLEDIRNTRRIDSVITGGRLLTRKYLDTMLAGAAAKAARM